MKILVLQGPNLNLLGRREPHLYGKLTLADIHQRLHALARELKVELITFQSNIEGEIVNKLHQHMDEVDGALINPAGLTQFGVSVHDAIKTMPFPVIEVHISNRHQREEWRHHSIISSAAKGTVEGLGWRSYTAALRTLVEILRDKKK
jgi:3-dehydroquinate dehydratase II